MLPPEYRVIDSTAAPCFSGGETSSHARPSGSALGEGSVVNVFGEGTPSTCPAQLLASTR